jgi:hypothetical protein
MLLRDIFLNKEDLETALKSGGYNELLPFYRHIYDHEEEYVQQAGANAHLGMMQIPGTTDAVVFGPGSQTEIDYFVALSGYEHEYLIFKLNCAEEMADIYGGS